jgi:hypothetical protein
MIKQKLSAKQYQNIKNMKRKLPETCSECPMLEYDIDNQFGMKVYFCGMRSGDDIIPGGTKFVQRKRCKDCPLADKSVAGFGFGEGGGRP